LEGGQRTIAEAELSNHCEVVSGDFFRSVPGGDADILSRVIHDSADEKAVATLKIVRGALVAKGRLLLFETMIRADNRLSYPVLSDLNMVIRTDGRERAPPTSTSFADWSKVVGIDDTPKGHIIHAARL
jgi:hypothetical protein